MRVAFVGRGLDLASTRYRVVIPAMYLQSQGHEITKDAPLLVFSKSNVGRDVLDLYPKKVYDICDDNFDCPKRGPEYRGYAKESNAVTVNSDVMRFIVHKQTGRSATVIPDPYEREEWAPSWGEGLLWFGHWTNVKDLRRSGLKATILTNPDAIPADSDTRKYLDEVGCVTWSPEAMDAALKAHALVVIPTGRSMAKSANRLIESVRAGKFVVCEPLPAYEEFSEFMWVGDIREGVEWALRNPQECQDRVRYCQNYIRERFSPETIGRKWLALLSSI